MSIYSRSSSPGFTYHFLLLVFLGGCTGTSISDSLGDRSERVTPLSAGIYRGDGLCEVNITDPFGRQTVQEQRSPSTLHINERGLLVVDGREIRVGRTIELLDLELTYTRIESTSTGLVIHGNVGGRINSLSVSGFSIAEMKQTVSGAIEYDITMFYIDSVGFSYSSQCSALLLP
jgi:hypothetical protein